MNKIQSETVILLGLLFVFYVVGDLLSTIWLVENHPEGIKGESNPLAILIFNEHSIMGLILSKILLFIAISVAVIIIEFNFQKNKLTTFATNYSILGLMAWSIIAVSVNVMLVYTLSLEKGSYESEFLPRTYMTILGVTIAGLIILPKFYRKSLGVVEWVLAFLVIVVPFVISPGLYQYLLNKSIVNLVIYLTINSALVSLMIYTMNMLYKKSIFYVKE